MKKVCKNCKFYEYNSKTTATETVTFNNIDSALSYMESQRRIDIYQKIYKVLEVRYTPQNEMYLETEIIQEHYTKNHLYISQ